MHSAPPVRSIADDAEQSRRYLEAIVGDVVPEERRDTFLDRGPEVMDFLLDKTPVRFTWVPEYSDYLPEQPGGRPRGRSVEPIPMDGRILGAELDRLHPPYAKAPANLIVTQADFRKISLGLRTLRGPLTMMRVMFMRMVSSLRGRRMYAMGNALTISLRKALMDAGVPVHYETPLTGLIIEGGRVVGVRAERDGAEVVIRARRGVILGSGGFEKSEALREKYLPSPTDADWSTAAPSNTGAGIEAGVAIGAATDLMDDAWWGPTIPLPSGPWFCLAERNLPGSIIVNSAGKRFMNEALPYVEATHAIYEGEATGVSHVPAWLVMDQRYRNRYLFAGLSPRQPFPGRWYKFGTVRKASSLERSSPRRSTSPPRRSRRPSTGSTGSPSPASTRTSTAATARTTATTPTRASSPTRRCTASTADRSMPSRSSRVTLAPRAESSPTSVPARCGPTGR